METRQEETVQPQPRRRSRVLASYSIAGASLAVLRLAILVRLGYVASFTGTTIDRHLLWGMYPEALLGRHTPLNLIPVLPSTFRFFLLWVPIVVVLSFVLATPVLAAGWLLRRPALSRPVVVCYLSSGAALAILRVAVLVSVSGLSEAQSYIPWALYPEALLMIHTRLGALGWYDAHFVFAALLAGGSYVMTMPILLVGSSARRRR